MDPARWIPAIIAVASVIAHAAITQSTVSRHEKDIQALETKVQSLCTKVAVLEERLKGGDAA